MEAEGMDGRIVADATGVTLYFTSLTARAEKKAVSPRQLPWESITAVTFTKGGLRPGSLRVHVLGEQPNTVRPERDLNTLLVNVGKQTDACRLFAEQVTERLLARAGALPTTVDPGESEASVREARSRMGVMFGGRRELRKLAGQLIPGERARYAATGRVGNGSDS